MYTNPKLSTGKIVQYSLADIAKGLFTGMVGTYLLYFYQPTAEAGIPNLLPDNFLGFITIMTLLTTISKIFDILAEPIVSKYTDRCKSKYGRRMPFLRIFALPYALSALLIFFAPFKEGSVGNAVWVGVFLTLFYIFHTLYFLPQRALVPEVIEDPNKRVAFFSISTTCFIASTCFMYLTTLFVDAFKNIGLDTIWAWRSVFSIFTVIGLICLFLSAFAFSEKKYAVKTNAPTESLGKSFEIVLKNRDFVLFSFSDLFSHTALACFQTALMYYMTVLIQMDEKYSFVVMLCEMGAALICFPIITKATKNVSKRTLIIIATIMFTVLYVFMFFGNSFANMMPGYEVVLGVLMGIAVAYPFAAIHVIPQSLLSDIIQADTLTSGVNREGAFAAVRDFMEKLAHAIAMILISSIVVVGASEGSKVGLLGVKITTIVGAVLCLISTILYFIYSDKKVMEAIKIGTENHVHNEECFKGHCPLEKCEDCPGVCTVEEEFICEHNCCGKCCSNKPVYDLYDSEVVAVADPKEETDNKDNE